MFPVQQGATWPSQLWPPRLGIKLLEGAPSTEKSKERCVFSRDITKNRCYQPSFCTVDGKGPKWSYQPCHPCKYGSSSLLLGVLTLAAVLFARPPPSLTSLRSLEPPRRCS